jgi:hypothetical protein
LHQASGVTSWGCGLSYPRGNQSASSKSPQLDPLPARLLPMPETKVVLNPTLLEDDDKSQFYPASYAPLGIVRWTGKMFFAPSQVGFQG